MTIRRYEHVAGARRDELRSRAVKQYKAGATVRQIAKDLGRSYGFVHKLLLETPGVEFRSRGARQKTAS